MCVCICVVGVCLFQIRHVTFELAFRCLMSSTLHLIESSTVTAELQDFIGLSLLVPNCVICLFDKAVCFDNGIISCFV